MTKKQHFSNCLGEGFTVLAQSKRKRVGYMSRSLQLEKLGVSRRVNASIGSPRQLFSTPREIRWTFVKRLEDLDFADDICMLAPHRLQDTQEQLDQLHSTGQRTGLKIDIGKTKTMRINTHQHNNVMLNGKIIEDVGEFKYLGSIVSCTGGTEENIKARRKKAH